MEFGSWKYLGVIFRLVYACFYNGCNRSICKYCNYTSIGCIFRINASLYTRYIGFKAIADFSLLGSFDYIFENLGFEAHYKSLSRGLVDTRDQHTLYLLSFYSFSCRDFFLQKKEEGCIEATRLLIIVYGSCRYCRYTNTSHFI